MSKIYDLTRSYRMGRLYVTWSFRHFYSKFIVLGKKNIPSEGPVVFGPNHLNALMDALVILTATPKKLSNVFLARSDIFKNKTAAKILRFLKILPAFRMRDGIENLGKNNETFAAAQEVLDEKNALCIMPEGSQGDQRKLRPMMKGLFRVAFSAQEKYGNAPGVNIIPVGLDYSDRVKFGANVIVEFGNPIPVSEYMDLYKENPAVAINELRARFKKELHNITVDLATETRYDCFEKVMEVSNTDAVRQLGLKNTEGDRLIARRKIGEYLVRMENEEPDKMEILDKVYAEYHREDAALHIPVSVQEKPWGAFKIIFGFLLLLLTLPVFVTGFILNMFPFFLPPFIRKKMGVKYDGFFSSFDYVLGGVILFPLFYFIQTILFAIFSPTPWWAVPIFAVAQFFLGKLSYIWYTCAGKFVQNVRYCLLRLSKKKQIANLQKARKDIIALVQL